MDIKPSSSTIAALGQQTQKSEDLTKTIRKQHQASDERAGHLRAKKANKKQQINQVRQVDEARKASSKIEIKAAQSRVENVRTMPKFAREAPLAIAGPPKFQRMGQIVDIKV